MTKDKQLHIRVTEEELDFLKGRAGDMKVSEWVRSVLFCKPTVFIVPKKSCNDYTLDYSENQTNECPYPFKEAGF